jgi:hypothetical protein
MKFSSIENGAKCFQIYFVKNLTPRLEEIGTGIEIHMVIHSDFKLSALTANIRRGFLFKNFPTNIPFHS